MKKEDNELLLNDLCARLPYGVKIALKNNGGYHHENIAKKGDVTIEKLKGFNLKGFNSRYFCIFHDDPNDWYWYDDDIVVDDIKPYLFPLSSMTEEQREYYEQFTFESASHFGFVSEAEELIAWLNKNHFDYRGLIEKGLAIDATGKNIY